MPVPSAADLQRAHAVFAANEPRAVDFDVAVRLLEQALGASDRLSPTLPTAMLLQSWNFAYYQDGRVFNRAHFEQLDRVLEDIGRTLVPFRGRHLESFVPADEKVIAALFDRLGRVVGRVGAAKVLHLWAPAFFPLWDTPIAAAYGFDLSVPIQQYLSYMAVVRKQVERLVPPPGVPPLKALDEYNYCVFTKEWLAA